VTTTTTSKLRQRQREATFAEIERVAMRQLLEGGPDSLSMRAVARELGVSVQALYHYVDSRDALVTLLVTAAHNGLADAIAQSAELSAGQGPEDRGVAAGLAYRQWAIDNRGSFLLIYGVPLPHYEAPEDGPTTRAAGRLAHTMREVLFGEWTEAELARVPLPADTEELQQRLLHADERIGLALPPGALALFFSGWAQLHGLVLLEVLGHLPWLGSAAHELHRTALLDVVRRLQAYRDAAPPAA
jgi:AcrR family transcriptional regulator